MISYLAIKDIHQPVREKEKEAFAQLWDKYI